MSKKKLYKRTDSNLEDQKYYVFKADGVNFKEFRVGKKTAEEIDLFHKVMCEVTKNVMKKHKFIKLAYTFDDEISLLMKANNSMKEKRIQKNLSLLTSCITASFNREVTKMKVKKPGEYCFDGRFYKVLNEKGVIEYFDERQKLSYTQVKNLLSHNGDTGKKPNIETIVSIYFFNNGEHYNYCSLFGSFFNKKGKYSYKGERYSQYIKKFTEFVKNSL